MSLTLGTVTASDPQSLKAAIEQTVRYVNQLEDVIVRMQQAKAGTPLNLDQIRQALQVTGTHPLNVAGLPGTLTQNQPHTTP